MVTSTGVTFVIPVRNGAAWLRSVLDSVLAQADGRPFEVIVVDDGSVDGSAEILERYAATAGVRVIPGPTRGVTAALNEGIRRASHPYIAQIDQDVVLEPGWMATLTAALADSRIAAAQGYYMTPPGARVWAQVMGLDLQDRYHTLTQRPVDHVCTGNTVYRAEALAVVGLFDESLGYGYDNDISYRLVDAGFRLVIRGDARSTHWWRDTLWHYLVQQYGFGYGRLDLIAKHRHRVTGDDVSRLPMMLHAPVMLLAMGLAASSLPAALVGGPARVLAVGAAVLVVALAVERLIAGARAAIRLRNVVALWFVPMHLIRDVAWAIAVVVWCVRRLAGIAPTPEHSMHPRAPGAKRS